MKLLTTQDSTLVKSDWKYLLALEQQVLSTLIKHPFCEITLENSLVSLHYHLTINTYNFTTSELSTTRRFAISAWNNPEKLAIKLVLASLKLQPGERTGQTRKQKQGVNRIILEHFYYLEENCE